MDVYKYFFALLSSSLSLFLSEQNEKIRLTMGYYRVINSSAVERKEIYCLIAWSRRNPVYGTIYESELVFRENIVSCVAK